MIKRGLTLVSAVHITVSVFINDDAGLWAGCTTAPAKPGNASLWPERRDRDADAPLKRQVMGRIGRVLQSIGMVEAVRRVGE
jgi:hypothetical protein